MTLRSVIESKLAPILASKGIPSSFGGVVVSGRPELSQFQCNGILGVAKSKGLPPQALAQEIANELRLDADFFKDVSVAGPGFLNITLQDSVLIHHTQSIGSSETLGVLSENTSSFVIDFGGPNVAKAMHVGHIRSSIIGDCLQRMGRFLGHKITSDVHLGDWGLPMGMLLGELQRRQPDLPYFDPNWTGEKVESPIVTIHDLEEMYPKAALTCKEDESAREDARLKTAALQNKQPGLFALWRHFIEVSLESLKEEFKTLGVHFDLWLGESHVHDRIAPLVERLKAQGVAQLDEGAWIIPLEEGTDSKPMPPLILLKSDGGVMYGVTDLATIEDRIETVAPDTILYVVDQRQNLHFDQVFRSARISGFDKVSLEHIGFGTLNGPDGKPFKTRDGGVMRLSALLDLVHTRATERLQEAGIAQDFTPEEFSKIAKLVSQAAIKYSDLSKPRLTNYVFDVDQFTSFEGATGPYLLYAAVRIKSILRRAYDARLEGGELVPHDSIRDLMLKINEFEPALRTSFDKRAPHILCEYVYTLGALYSKFYQSCHILKEGDSQLQKSWIRISEITLKVFEISLDLLGIHIPDRM